MCCCPLMDNYICTAGSDIEATQCKILASVGTQKYLEENRATRVTGWQKTRVNLNLKINSPSLKVRKNQVIRWIDISESVESLKILFIATEANDERHGV